MVLTQQYSLTQHISSQVGVSYIPHPEGTEIIKRRIKEKEYLMLLNYTESEIVRV